MLPESDCFVEKISSASICVEDLKQALIGLTCVHKGSVSFIVNLLHQTRPYEKYDEVWHSQYGDGAGNEVYAHKLHSLFIGKSFALVSSFLYREYQVTLFGLQVYNKHRGLNHTILNPGHEFKITASDVGIFLSQDMKTLNDIDRLNYSALNTFESEYNQTEENVEIDIPRDDIRLSRLAPRKSTLRQEFLSTEGLRTLFPKLKNEFPCYIGTPKPPCADMQVSLCHLLKEPPTSMEEFILTGGTHLSSHIIVCTDNFDLFKFVCTVRAAHLKETLFRTILILCERLPTRSEFNLLAVFPKILYIQGKSTKKDDLLNAGLLTCDKVVVINVESRNLNDTEGVDNEFADSASVMITHLIYNICSENQIKKIVITELRIFS